MGEIEIGRQEIFTRKITLTLVTLFSVVTGDYNPLHTNKDFPGKDEVMKKLGVTKIVAHEMMSASFINAALWRLGGNEAIFGEMGKLRFLKPVEVGDIVSVKITVKAKKNHRLILDVKYTNQRDEDIIEPTEAVLFVF